MRTPVDAGGERKLQTAIQMWINNCYRSLLFYSEANGENIAIKAI